MTKETSRGRILVVDDNPANRRLLEVQLVEAGFEVMTAVNGGRCLEMARTEAPEVILLDIRMPGMDGVETCRRLKENFETQHIPVLFVTNFGDDEPTAIEALEAGGNDFVSKDCSHHILAARVASQLSISRSQRRLQEMAMTDELTGVVSRRCLFDALRRAVRGTSRVGPKTLSYLLVDVDRFKRINDDDGHLEGDQALRSIAQTIDATTRESDMVGRFGGDEFVVILPATDLDGAVGTAEKVRTAVREKCRATVSIGVAALEAPTAEELRADEDAVDRYMKTLLKRADVALYVAKARGRDRAVAWDAEVQREHEAQEEAVDRGADS
jgi:diguanylate cyclase (GGDEF)-like protein